jgi:hypothetical protein
VRAQVTGAESVASVRLSVCDTFRRVYPMFMSRVLA